MAATPREKSGLSAAQRFRYLYLADELQEWVEPVRGIAAEADQVHVLLNNCYLDYAVRNARGLAGLLSPGSEGP